MKFLLLVSVFAAMFVASSAPCTAAPSTVTDDTFFEEVLRADSPVLVEFWRENCPPCRRMARVVDELSEDYAGRVKVVRLDTEASEEMISLYEIESVPTFIYFKDGYEVARASGSMSKEALKRKLGLN